MGRRRGARGTRSGSSTKSSGTSGEYATNSNCANAVGPRLQAEAVRAAMLSRANQMALGGSGAQPAVAELLVAMLNAGVHP